MSTVNPSSPLSTMLANAFTRLDRDGSKGLDRGEFQAFYEVLKPGIATDEQGKHRVSEGAQFDRMDRNADGVVTLSEVQTTGVLMPAQLSDDSLGAMIEYLRRLDSAAAAAAASLLEQPVSAPGE